jgi:hypothetical protein
MQSEALSISLIPNHLKNLWVYLLLELKSLGLTPAPRVRASRRSFGDPGPREKFKFLTVSCGLEKPRGVKCRQCVKEREN